MIKVRRRTKQRSLGHFAPGISPVTNRPVIGITTEMFAITDDHPSAATAFRQHNSAQRDPEHFSTI